jgi:hypothetical protein
MLTGFLVITTTSNLSVFATYQAIAFGCCAVAVLWNYVFLCSRTAELRLSTVMMWLAAMPLYSFLKAIVLVAYSSSDLVPGNLNTGGRPRLESCTCPVQHAMQCSQGATSAHKCAAARVLLLDVAWHDTLNTAHPACLLCSRCLQPPCWGSVPRSTWSWGEGALSSASQALSHCHREKRCPSGRLLPLA